MVCLDRLFDQPNPALVPAETGLLSITVQGQTALGMADNYPRLNPTENRHQIADNLTWTSGKHTFRFGGDIMNTNDVSKRLQNRNGYRLCIRLGRILRARFQRADGAAVLHDECDGEYDGQMLDDVLAALPATSR